MTTDTQTNDTLIEEMIRDAEKAPEPGVMDKVLHRGNEGQPAPMTLSELTSAGWVYIYEVQTGERSKCNRNMLPQLLKVKNKDNTPRFTTAKPVNPPFPVKVGHFKCKLHSDDPDRARYDELALPTCRKSNLTSLFMVTQHMKKRHPQEWQTIDGERIDRERREDREIQQAVLGVVRAGEKPPLYVSKKDRDKENANTS
uniref:Uncharacterized protein n=1 Tax=viral metagenome TaxID=1070528 RepID=A0A6M3K1N7_9ZZZZ